MRTMVVSDFESWRAAARPLLVARVNPEDVTFRDSAAPRGLFDDESSASSAATLPERQLGRKLRVPRPFLDLARRVACHSDVARFDLLYRILYRLLGSEPHLLEVATDDDVYRLHTMGKAVARDAHKTKAFVRFRRLTGVEGEHFVAWHRPDHPILKLVGPFFARRFRSMRWTILTPRESAAWDLQELTYGPGADIDAAPDADQLDELWKTYYAAIFNPARVKERAMVREMPRRHWATLPETDLLPELLRDAPGRVAEMVAAQKKAYPGAEAFLPDAYDYDSLRSAAAECEGCDLCRHATQTVFGEGPGGARMMLVGEQPGDQEDRQGHPFVGPAGAVLDESLAEAGIDRSDVYLTNTVKHFNFIQRGKRRLHKKPGAREIAACDAWLQAELKLVQPRVLVCLGATAAQAIIGRDFRITKSRGQLVETSSCAATIATYHPSAVLRGYDAEARDRTRQALVEDLRLARSQL